ncbi:hypothetical protein NIES4071_102160 (plasmid) [Calothrix sp. NIES-4071]|nr:hypothetical protein NIES4071_102160 [Calothrix sp. NIES-4071]BAZ64597.1 hypothetical protein NIES4105_103300 [Calothrix sp. NIES-4105]
MAIKNGKVPFNSETETETDVPNTVSGITGKRRSEEERRKAASKYLDPKHNKPISSAPITQIINIQDPTKVGLFIKEAALTRINWKGEEAKHKHTFSNGEEETGILLQSPRLNIIQKSYTFPEARKDLDDGTTSGTLANMILETNDGREFYNKNKATHVLRRFYFAFVLDENNNNLHDTPIAITMKGVQLVKFDIALEAFYSDIDTAFANFYGEDRCPKDDEFHRMCVFNPTFAPSHEPKTEPKATNRSWVAIVEKYETPKQDGSNFLDFFCEWKSKEYATLVATNPDLTMSIGKAAPIVEEHNRLVVEGRVERKLLLPATLVDDDIEVNDNPPY